MKVEARIKLLNKISHTTCTMAQILVSMSEDVHSNDSWLLDTKRKYFTEIYITYFSKLNKGLHNLNSIIF